MYHYTESGLDNVWLENGYKKHKTAYGEGVSIQDTAGLHKAIGLWIVSLPKPINGAELRFLRTELEMTQRNLADILNVEEQALRRWEKARKKPMQGAADRLLRGIYKETVEGNGTLKMMIERLNMLDQIDEPKGRFRESLKGWEPDKELIAA